MLCRLLDLSSGKSSWVAFAPSPPRCITWIQQQKFCIWVLADWNSRGDSEISNRQRDAPRWSSSSFKKLPFEWKGKTCFKKNLTCVSKSRAATWECSSAEKHLKEKLHLKWPWPPSSLGASYHHINSDVSQQRVASLRTACTWVTFTASRGGQVVN